MCKLCRIILVKIFMNYVMNAESSYQVCVGIAFLLQKSDIVPLFHCCCDIMLHCIYE